MSTDPINTLRHQSDRFNHAMEKASSGSANPRPSDDSATKALVSQTNAEAVIVDQARQNTKMGHNMIEIGDSAMQGIGDILNQMQGIATQAASGTVSGTQRDSLDATYQSLRSEIFRIAGVTENNGTKIFSTDGSAPNEMTLQVGEDGSANSQLSISGTDLSFLSAVPESIAGDGSQALAAMDQISGAISNLSSKRADFGAIGSRLDSAESYLSALSEQKKKAASVGDADMAEVAAEMQSAKIGQDIAAKVSKLKNQQGALAASLIPSKNTRGVG